MSPITTKSDTTQAVQFLELRRFQVYRLQRPRRRPWLQRLRRTVRAHLAR